MKVINSLMNKVVLKPNGYAAGSAATVAGARNPINKKRLLRIGEINAVTKAETSRPR